MEKTRRVAVLVYTDCLAMEVFAVCDLLLVANRMRQAEGPEATALFETELVSARGGPVRAAGGFQLSSVQPCGRYDLLVVPGFDFSSRDALPAKLNGLWGELEIIHRVYAEGSALASVCVGAFLLAEAGLLNGRRATTGWLFAPLLAEQYPQVKVDADTLLVEDQGITTTGSYTAASDFAIHYLARMGEPDLAARVAGVTLVDNARESQAPFIDRHGIDGRSIGRGDVDGVAGRRFSEEIKLWLNEHYRDSYNAEILARAFSVSQRTLLRRFKAETGLSPLSYLQSYRIHVAKQLLRTTTLSISEITAKVGYNDVASFCSLFRREVRLSPGEYRTRFASPARAEEGGDQVRALETTDS